MTHTGKLMSSGRRLTEINKDALATVTDGDVHIKTPDMKSDDLDYYQLIADLGKVFRWMQKYRLSKGCDEVARIKITETQIKVDELVTFIYNERITHSGKE